MCISYRQFHNAFATLQVSGRQWKDEISDDTGSSPASPLKQAIKQVMFVNIRQSGANV